MKFMSAKGMNMFSIDTEYGYPPNFAPTLMAQTTPAANITQALDNTILSLTRDYSRKVRIYKITIETFKKT